MRFLRWAAVILIIIAIPFILGQVQLVIPQIILKQKTMSDKGIYITYYTATSKSRMAYIKNILKTRGLNTLVVDTNYFIDQDLIPLLKEKKINMNTEVKPNAKLKALIDELHKEGIIYTARIVAFKDDRLVLTRPDLGIQLPGGGLYRDRKGGKWPDPYSEEVRAYKLLMAEIAAASGADEIQFDYIRFPAEGLARNAVLPHEIEGVSRVDLICEFLKDVRERLKKYNTSLAIDIFGVTAWQSKTDIESLGQDISKMAKYIDVLSPMLYPSHFHNGYDGFANPGSEPYYFLNTGVIGSQKLISNEATTLVPWIQGFNLKSPNFGPEYIRQQVKGCNDAGVKRFLIWNARNDYDVVPSGL